MDQTTKNRHLGSVSPTYLHTAFTPVAPKSVRNQSSHQYLFTLLGSTGTKAVHRTLMKLIPVVNVINILQTAFLLIFFCQKLQSQTVTRENLQKNFCMKKAPVRR